MELQRKTLIHLNCIRTSQGQCYQLLNKWKVSDNPNCDCGKVQSIDHIIMDCPARRHKRAMDDFFKATNSAIEWIKNLIVELKTKSFNEVT